MNRRGFFGLLGGVAAAAVVPRVAQAAEPMPLACTHPGSVDVGGAHRHALRADWAAHAHTHPTPPVDYGLSFEWAETDLRTGNRLEWWK